jgi:pimeloyl-ACP methyl ester carboxylesterase
MTADGSAGHGGGPGAGADLGADAGAGAHPGKRRLRVLLIVIGAAAVLVVGAGAGGRSFARAGIYPAPAVPVGPPPAGITEIRLPGGGTEVSVAWTQARIPAEAPTLGAVTAGARAPVLLYLHGNGENLATMERRGTIGRLGGLDAAAWVALDYPGYGRSSGEPSEAALIDAAERALGWIGGRYPGHPVVVVGRSLGAAVAVGLAARGSDRIMGLVLFSPFSTLEDVAARIYPRWLVRLLVADRYPSVALAPRVGAPAYVVHGERDELVPIDQGRRLCQRLPRCLAFVPVPGAGHNDLMNAEEPWRAVADLLAMLTPAAPHEAVRAW